MIQSVLAEIAIAALNIRILGQIARLYEVQLRAGSLQPEEHGLAGVLQPAIADNRFGQRSLLREPVELACQSLAGDREINQLQLALTRKIVDDIQHPEVAPVCQLVTDKVNEPAYVHLVGHRDTDLAPLQDRNDLLLGIALALYNRTFLGQNYWEIPDTGRLELIGGRSILSGISPTKYRPDTQRLCVSLAFNQ